MIIFDDPGTAPYVGAALAIVCFAIQLLFCFIAKKPAVRRIPVYLILAAWGFILLISTGIFGTDGGFIGNVHLVVAAILAIVLGVASLGDALAWLVYWIYARAKAKRTPAEYDCDDKHEL